MSIERRFDISLIAGMALREKRIQQNYRPIIGVHNSRTAPAPSRSTANSTTTSCSSCPAR